MTDIPANDTAHAQVVADPDGRSGRLTAPGLDCACILGKGGIIPDADKREGDGATPLGRYAVRRVLYRADRVARPQTRLPVSAITESDGWCDAPEDPNYNRQVRLPYAASHERLYRDDHVYDLILIIGHNDDPVMANMGSAIFLHLRRPDGRPTEGCIAVGEDSFRQLVAGLDIGDYLDIRRGSGR